MTALEIRQLTKRYNNGVQALKGIDLDVQEGDFFALLGPNGAGKSTTIGILMSLVNKTAGKVRIFGHDIDKEFSKAKTFVGFVPQEFNFNIFEPPLQILIEQAGYYGINYALAKERAEYYLKKLELWEKRSFPSRMLSGGMKRRLMIARALVHEPKLLILDEPTAGVDIEIRRSMWAFLQEINKRGTTIILTTHYLEEAENLCNFIAIIDHGRIIENTSMRNFLDKLHIETFILYLDQPLSSPVILEGFSSRQIDQSTLEVVINKGDVINKIFEQLSKQNIRVKSFRNKSNRLEELFIRLTGKTSNHEDQK